MSAEDASTGMLVLGRTGRSSRLVADKLLPVRDCVATSRPGSAIAQLEAEPWRAGVGASPVLIDEIDRPRVRRSLT
jgi:hypothetical protein